MFYCFEMFICLFVECLYGFNAGLIVFKSSVIVSY